MMMIMSASLWAFGCARSEEPSFRPARTPSEEARSNHQSQAAAEREVAHEPTIPSAEVPVQAQAQAGLDPRLLEPSGLTERAPDQFVVEFDTTKGPIRIEVTRAWSPNGADRFYNLVRAGYYTDVVFFRVIEGFMAQVGIHGNPEVNRAWRNANIPDDPPAQSNTRGMVSYAMGGPGTRTTQFFISFGDNSRLDTMGFAPFGRVVDMSAVDRLYSGYGEGAPSGRGPMQARIQQEGNAYLRASFPELDTIRSARIVSVEPGGGAPPR
jgi:peptidyl-prolyl cis-trans isomerase A (cyclophilin A)